MDGHEGSDKQEAQSERPGMSPKIAYSPPALLEFGKIRNITTNGSGTEMEDDMKMAGPTFIMP